MQDLPSYCSTIHGGDDDEADEEDKAEAFEDIMAKLDASRTQSLSSTSPLWTGQGQVLADTQLDHTLLSPQRARGTAASQSRSLAPVIPQASRSTSRTGSSPNQRLHPRPFGCARAVGGLFSDAGVLPNKDLTAWEIQKATSPERSWPTSTNDCVATHTGFRSPGHSSGFLPSPTMSAHSTASNWHSETRRTSNRSGWAESSRSDRSWVGIEASAPSSKVVSRAQRATSSPALPCSRPKLVVQRVVPDAVVTDVDGEEWTLQAEEMRLLQDRKRRLMGELSRTERRLLEVSVSATSMTSQRSEQASDVQALPSPVAYGCRGSSKTPQRQEEEMQGPQAGGPFAGPRGMHRRANAATWMKSRNDVAKESYAYLGPGSDGDPGPPIHPLWS